MQQIENSKKKSEIDSLRDEVLVVPYDSLAPISEGSVKFNFTFHLFALMNFIFVALIIAKLLLSYSRISLIL